MRPVTKGKNEKDFSDYQWAKGDLTWELEYYCSYCEIVVQSGIHVEHVQPKIHHPELLREWDNFLLACTNCNSNKGTDDINLETHLWPHRDNTFRAFRYSEGGVIKVNPGLNAPQTDCAQNTLNLMGLEKREDNDRKKDQRWFFRKRAWRKATDALKRLKRNDCESMREQIVDTAIAQGFWSVWMTVFKDEHDMLKEFIKNFPGTCKECFDKNGSPIQRKDGIV